MLGNKSSIEMYLHCGKCLEELPAGESPASYSRNQAGLTKDGDLQVWCNRHDIEVVTLAKPSGVVTEDGIKELDLGGCDHCGCEHSSDDPSD